MLRSSLTRGLAVAFGSTFTLLSSMAQSPYATQIVNVVQGPGLGTFQPSNLLGGPRGGGFQGGGLHVHSLGVAGSVTLGFEVVLRDGPGADFTVFENGLAFGAGIFAEVVTVEVSSDGQNFAAFETSYAGPAGPLPAFGTSPIGTFSGLAGGLPVLANVAANGISPLDPVVSGGESFDLADLVQHPLVVAGTLDLQGVRFVRLVDVEEGTLRDRAGRLIWDHGGPSSSADVDAVAVLQSDANRDQGQPTCDLNVDAQGFLHWRLSDPNGFADLDLSTLHASLDLQPLPLLDLVQAFAVVDANPQGLHLRSLLPISGTGLLGAFAASVRDAGGQLSGDQVILQG